MSKRTLKTEATTAHCFPKMKRTKQAKATLPKRLLKRRRLCAVCDPFVGLADVVKGRRVHAS